LTALFGAGNVKPSQASKHNNRGAMRNVTTDGRQAVTYLPWQEVQSLRSRYHELLYAIASKHDGETRHETTKLTEPCRAKRLSGKKTMEIQTEQRATYPDNWKDIAKRIKDAAGWKCERCKEPHRVEGAFVLTVHHLDGNKANCADWNLAALCQRCHLKIQGRVKMNQMFFAEILHVSEWFKPHLEGYLSAKSPNDQAHL
jgi:hypothetical protein